MNTLVSRGGGGFVTLRFYCKTYHKPAKVRLQTEISQFKNKWVYTLSTPLPPQPPLPPPPPLLPSTPSPTQFPPFPLVLSKTKQKTTHFVTVVAEQFSRAVQCEPFTLPLLNTGNRNVGRPQKSHLYPRVFPPKWFNKPSFPQVVITLPLSPQVVIKGNLSFHKGNTSPTALPQ